MWGRWGVTQAACQLGLSVARTGDNALSDGVLGDWVAGPTKRVRLAGTGRASLVDAADLGGTQEHRLQIREEVRVQGLAESAVVSGYFKLSVRRWTTQI